MPIAPRLDDTDPALPALRLEVFPSAAATLIVLTRDPQLLETLRNVAAGREVAAVEAESGLASQLMRARGGVALIDSAALTSPLTHLTERLKAQFPDLVLVVAGDSEDQNALTQHITRGTVYRFLHKPLSEQRVKLFVEAAWRRHGEEHAGIVGAARTQPTRTLPAAKPRNGLWIAVAAGIVVVGAIAWLALRAPEPVAAHTTPPARPRAVPPPPAATETARVEDTAPADEARSSPGTQVGAPPANQISPSVAEHATPQIPPSRPGERTVAQTPPPNAASSPPSSESAPPRPRPAAPAAAAPIATPSESAPSALAERIISEAHNAIDAGKLDEAERLIQIAAEAGVDEEDLNDLLRKAKEQRITARGGAMTRLSQLFNERMAQGKLLEPANDSAKHYVSELVATDPEHPSTRMARETFASRLVREARNSSASDLAAARHWLVEARAASADESAIAAVEKDIYAAQEATTKANEVVSSTSLRKLHHVDPAYPSVARSKDLSGWVDLELTVKTDGSVDDIVVTRADPPDIFDKAAIEAVRQWRYEPVQRDGKVVEQRTRLRIRFQLQ